MKLLARLLSAERLQINLKLAQESEFRGSAIHVVGVSIVNQGKKIYQLYHLLNS